jgi:hypothetical protein
MRITDLIMYSMKHGRRYFNASTPFDMYIARNLPYIGGKTYIEDLNGEQGYHDISRMEVIPNHSFDLVEKYMAKEGGERLCVLHSYSSYFTRAAHMSKDRSEEFCYPVVYTCNSSRPSSDPAKFHWSSRNDRGHFGVPKIFWANGKSSLNIDGTGEYGLTQFAYGVAFDNPGHRDRLYHAMHSDEFRRVMDACAIRTLYIYNHRVLALMRKDFWKEVESC